MSKRREVREISTETCSTLEVEKATKLNVTRFLVACYSGREVEAIGYALERIDALDALERHYVTY